MTETVSSVLAKGSPTSGPIFGLAVSQGEERTC